MAVSFVASGVVWRWLMNSGTGDNARRPQPALRRSLHLGFLENRGGPTRTGAWRPWRCRRSGSCPATSWRCSWPGSAASRTELREAAVVDGASTFQLYRHVLFPQLTPVALSALIITRPHVDEDVRPDHVRSPGRQYLTEVPVDLRLADACSPATRPRRPRSRSSCSSSSRVRHRPVPDLHQPGGEATHDRRRAATAPDRGSDRRRTPPAPAADADDPAAGRSSTYVLAADLPAVIVLIPLYVLVVTSFKTGSDIGVTGQWNLPQHWTLASWGKAWDALQAVVPPHASSWPSRSRSSRR